MKETKEQELEKMYYDKLGMCGCGNPDDLKQFVVEIMESQLLKKEDKITYEEMKQKRENAFKKCGMDTVLEFILHSLDHHGFWEHGGYVGNGWLTDDGCRLLELLKQDLNGMIYLDDDTINEINNSTPE